LREVFLGGQSTVSFETEYRPCVGIMLLNRHGEVLVGQRIDLATEAWQMPQGGIDEGEDLQSAALRELREEIGTDKAENLAESEGWLHYDLPAELAEKARHLGWHGQRQKWFVMRFTGTDADINLATEHPEFSAWRWVPIETLPDLIVSFKRQVYLDLLAEFGGLSRLSALMADPIVKLVMEADCVSESELYELLRRVSAALRQSTSPDTDNEGRADA
jgi:putative (di)nucleoside polyphosphate hydrolase